MTGVDSTIAARVPADLREQLEALAARTTKGDLSAVMRRLLREGVDREQAPVDVGLFDPRPGTARKNDRPTAKAAARLAEPRTGTVRYEALGMFATVAGNGATTDEIVEAFQFRYGGQGPAANGIARRVTDLLQGGYIEAAGGTVGSNGFEAALLTRPTRHNAQAQVWVITDKGRRALEATK